MAGKRRIFSGDEKVRFLRRQLMEHVPISDLRDEYGMHPTLLYKWQKVF